MGFRPLRDHTGNIVRYVTDSEYFDIEASKDEGAGFYAIATFILYIVLIYNVFHFIGIGNPFTKILFVISIIGFAYIAIKFWEIIGKVICCLILGFIALYLFLLLIKWIFS